MKINPWHVAKLYRWLFNFACRRIFKTKPVVCDPKSNIVILSQLYPPDLTMYLLAVKSFVRYLPVNHFVIVDDGLSINNRERLKHHLGNVRFVSISQAGSAHVPSGGCWERLASIARINSDFYVIQLDADILTIQKPVEVLAAVNQTSCFLLGTETGKEIIPAAKAVEKALTFRGGHIQFHAERVLDKTTIYKYPRYVRGCAGFSGFARGRLTLHELESLSTEMQSLVGAQKWSEWGSEQVASNLIIANSPDAIVLPVTSYPFFNPDTNYNDAKMIHFYGPDRFHGGVYLTLGRQVIRELLNHDAAPTGVP